MKKNIYKLYVLEEEDVEQKTFEFTDYEKAVEKANEIYNQEPFYKLILMEKNEKNEKILLLIDYNEILFNLTNIKWNKCYND